MHSVVTPAHLAGCSRLLLAPATTIVLYDSPLARVLGLIVIVLAGVSDILDGRLARRYGTVSTFGVFLDLTADKVFAAVALVSLLQIGRAPIAVVVIILMREFIVMGLRAFAAAQSYVVAAGFLGSLKTIVLFTGMGLVLIAEQAGLAALWIAAALAIVSGFQYTIDIAKHARSGTK